MSAAVSNDIRIPVRVCLFLSSISLLFIAVSLGCGLQFILNSCAFKASQLQQPWHIPYWIFAIVGVLGCLLPFGLITIFRDRNHADGKCVEIQDQSHDAVTHAVLYISLFVAHDCRVETYVWLALFVVLVSIIYSQTNQFILNPVLLMWGYRFYDTRFEFADSNDQQRFLILSKVEIRKGQAVSINRWSNKSLAILKEVKNAR